MSLYNLDIKFNNSDSLNEIILPAEISPELAEETGLHIGDGTMNFYLNKNKYSGKYSLRGHITDDKDHYNLIIKKLYKKVYNLKISLMEMKSTGVYGFQIWSDCIVGFKHKFLGLPLGWKTNIEIPSILMTNSDYFISVIRGIFDTDGCVYLEHKNNKLYPRIQIGTTSKILFEQIRNRLPKFGLRVTGFIEKREAKGWNNLYVLSIRGEEMLNNWMKIVEPKNPKHISKFNFYIDNS